MFYFLFIAAEKVAVKILDKTKLDAKTQRLLSREISSMERLHHPNIIRLYEVIETLSKLYLVMEYANNGELYTKISNDGRLPESEARLFFAQIVSAVDHMVWLLQLNWLYWSLRYLVQLIGVENTIGRDCEIKIWLVGSRCTAALALKALWIGTIGVVAFYYFDCSYLCSWCRSRERTPKWRYFCPDFVCNLTVSVLVTPNRICYNMFYLMGFYPCVSSNHVDSSSWIMLPIIYIYQ